MNIRDLFHKKRNKQELTERMLIRFGNPYDAEYYHPYSEYYRCGRRFDGQLCTVWLNRMPRFKLVSFHKGDWN